MTPFWAAGWRSSAPVSVWPPGLAESGEEEPEAVVPARLGLKKC